MSGRGKRQDRPEAQLTAEEIRKKKAVADKRKEQRSRRKEERENTTRTANTSRMPPNRPVDTFRESEMIRWFDALRTDETGKVEQRIGPAGLERLGKEIDKDVTSDIVFLFLAWKMGAKEMGYFSREEWVKGMTSLRVDCPEKLKGLWEQMRMVIERPENFRTIYRFAYDFTKESDRRHLDKPVAIELIEMLLAKRWRLCGEFCKFLDSHHLRTINKDQFNNVLEFSFLVKEDCSDYDMESAWPVLMDEFVSHMRENVFKKQESAMEEDESM